LTAASEIVIVTSFGSTSCDRGWAPLRLVALSQPPRRSLGGHSFPQQSGHAHGHSRAENRDGKGVACAETHVIYSVYECRCRSALDRQPCRRSEVPRRGSQCKSAGQPGRDIVDKRTEQAVYQSGHDKFHERIRRRTRPTRKQRNRHPSFSRHETRICRSIQQRRVSDNARTSIPIQEITDPRCSTCILPTTDMKVVPLRPTTMLRRSKIGAHEND
jgi:hypothetical protein